MFYRKEKKKQQPTIHTYVGSVRIAVRFVPNRRCNIFGFGVLGLLWGPDDFGSSKSEQLN